MSGKDDYYNLIVLGVPLPPQPGIEVPYPDGWTPVNEKTGCHFWGNKLIHTDACVCDWDFDEHRDSQL